jgi:hypothetical protein
LTGWDVDILTPPEFQNGVQRLDQTLKSIEGLTQEMVDKVIALGLIDVRDIEEVGAGPLMEELGLDEAKATLVVAKCAEEAKIVAVEQEAKKSAEASAKAADRAALAAGGRGDSAAARAFASALQMPQTEDVVTEISQSMPGALEAAAGGAPETVTHEQRVQANGDELAPEEQAIQGLVEENHVRKELPDEDEETAALAEGRIAPPEEQA